MQLIMTKKHNKKTGYSLLEVSIAMLIIGILLTSGSVLFSKISRNQNIKQAQLITLERTDKIYKAILNYLSENHKLPCPAKLNSSYDDADYGNESIGNDVAGECDETSFTGNNDSLPANYESDAQNLGATSNMKILYGMIPIDVLDLDKQDAQDGYGNKFSYIMVKEFGVKTPSHTAITGFEYFAGSNRLRDAAVTPEIIDYINIKSKQSGATTTLSNKSIMLIISHGENGLGAYIPDSGIQKPTVGAPNDEDRNMYANTNYDRVFFVDSDETKTANDEMLFFDDYVIFKTKDQLLRDAEMEFVKCGGQQGFINEDYNNPCFTGDFIPNRNSSYGETTDITNIVSTTIDDCGCIADGASLQRVCGKYGKWSDISCNENHVIHEIDQVRALENGNLQLSDDSGSGISIADGGEVS
ncbi:MAG: prepilin-type N-terminal cleavage/methylation domain-containing protein, partial [Rickettsiales bacterium]